MSEQALGQPQPSPEGSAPASAGLGSAGSQDTADWRISLNPDIRDNPTIRQIKAGTPGEALNSLASQLINAQKVIGGEKWPALRGTETPEQVTEWMRKHMGVPETADKYTLPEKIELRKNEKGEPVEVSVDPEDAKILRDLAIKNHLSPKQAEGVLSGYVSLKAQQAEAEQAALMETIKSDLGRLAQEWGPEYRANMDAANMGYSRLVPPDVQELFSKYQEITNHPGVIKMFSELGRQIADDSVRGPKAPGGNDIHSPSQARAAIDALEASEDYTKYLRGELNPHVADQLLSRRTDLYHKAYA